MRHDALRRAIGAGLVIAAAALLFGNNIVGSTGATFNASATNTGSGFSGGWVDRPAGATATASGYDVNLGWTPGTNAVTGQSIKGTYNGTSSNCSGAAYTDFSFNLGAAVSSTTDANRGVSHNGDWVCYEVVSTSATVWTQALPLSALQVGLAATNVSISNGGTSGAVDQGDTITITFNQAINLASGSAKVCVFANPDNTILVGDQRGGASCGSVTGDGYNIGTLTTSASLGSARFTNSSYTVSGNTITMTIGSGGSASASGASWTFTPAATIQSNAPADNAPACTSGSTCRPTTGSNF